MMESVAHTGEFAWLLWKRNPQSSSIIPIQVFQSQVRKNVIVDMAWVIYFHLHETQMSPHYKIKIYKTETDATYKKMHDAVKKPHGFC